jgi:serine/threonine-protein kinase
VSLHPGTRLGPYEIAGTLGAGGMGEVYRARDTKLGRDVALKILPDQFAQDPDRLARFEREAVVLASLNHPNIGAIYGLEEGPAEAGRHVRALVLELVEGQTLADRITAGAISLDEALPIARQICEALDAAHEQGIVHRDLKPANVKLRSDGAVKVLDFGLAKAMVPALQREATASPTLASPAATMAGVILGTAAYMSPEQAKGKPADVRSDIWAFGCVLYEMLTGKPAFTGEHVSEVLAAVLRGEPDWNPIVTIPPAITRLVRRCLDRDPNRRLHHIADARIEIEDAIAASGTDLASAATTSNRRSRWQLIALGLLSLAAGVIVGGALVAYLRPPPSSTTRPVTRFVVALPATERPSGLNYPVVAISPDGTRLAWVADNQRGNDQLFVRQVDRLTETAIPGTEGGHSPFFSHDGKWLGFFAQGKLKKVSLTGGTPVVLADAPDAHGGSWSEDDTIVFAPTASSPLSTVSANGGSPSRLTMLDAGKSEAAHRWPSHVPGARAVIFTAGPPDGGWDDSEIVMQSLETGARHALLRGGANGRYVPTGHLVYLRAGTLYAVPFDRARLTVNGDPIPVVDGIMTSESNLAAHFSFSSIGTLVYVPGSVGGAQRRLVWVDRAGASQPLAASARAYAMPRLSPDARLVAVQVEGISNDVWLWDTAREALTRLTFEGSSSQPTWSSDGRTVTFAAVRGNRRGLFMKAVDGSRREEPLSTIASAVPHSWSPDGKLLAFHQMSRTTGRDIWLLPREGDRMPQLLLGTPHDERVAVFSPDGKWLAYLSDESGREEVYVQAFPSSDGRWQISTDGGSEPVWARSGRELFYRRGNTLMSVDISTGPTFLPGTPKRLFEGRFVTNVGRANYDVSADGKQFLMIEAIGSESRTTQLNVVLEWFDELRQVGGRR